MPVCLNQWVALDHSECLDYGALLDHRASLDQDKEVLIYCHVFPT